MGAATLGPGVGDPILVGDGGRLLNDGGGVATSWVGNGSVTGSRLIGSFFLSLLGSRSTTTLSLLRPYRLMRAASLASSLWRRSWRRGLLLRPVLDTHALAFLGAPEDVEEVEDVVTGVVDTEAVLVEADELVGVEVYRPRRL